MKSSIFLFAVLAILATSAMAQPLFPFPRRGLPFPQLPQPSIPFPQFPQPSIPQPTNKPTTPPSPPASPSPPSPAAGGQHPAPVLPGITGDQSKCFQALQDNRLGSCIQDIINSSVTHQISISSGCCDLLTSCRPAFSFQQIPFLEQLITQYCST